MFCSRSPTKDACPRRPGDCCRLCLEHVLFPAFGEFPLSACATTWLDDGSDVSGLCDRYVGIYGGSITSVCCQKGARLCKSLCLCSSPCFRGWCSPTQRKRRLQPRRLSRWHDSNSLFLRS